MPRFFAKYREKICKLKWRATPNKGIIKINCFKDAKYLYIDFIDNGEGIDSDNIEHIFNPFFTTKMAGKGTGLGLYIVYNEIQKINGEISVESQLEIGTAFKLKFLIKESI